MGMNNILGTESLTEMGIRNRAIAEAGNHKNIIYPAIYKHFQNRFYATIGISEPTKMDLIIKDKTFLVAEHAENYKTISIFINEHGELGHCEEDSNETLVIYKSLYDGHIAYVSSLERFASEVDHIKHPKEKQKYRFEIVRY